MFGFLKKKSPKQRLEKRYQQLLAEAQALSTTDRRASDEKHAEAERVLRELQALEG